MRKALYITVARVLLLSVMFLSTQAIFSQTNNNHLMLGVGALYERGLEATLAYEHGTKYHNAWEYFGTYYIKYERDETVGHYTKDSFWNSHRSWHLGICYKPCVSRGRNHHGNLRIGASGGSDTSDFLAGVHVGYEHTYSMYNGWELFFQIKEDVMFPNVGDMFRTGVVLGVKAPL